MRILTGLLALCLSGFSFAGALPDSPHLYVKGTSFIQVQPDVATIRVAITEKQKSLPTAKENVDKIMAKAIEIAKRFDIKEDDIHAEQLNVYRQTRYNRESNEEEFDGFRVSRSLTVKLKDIKKYPELLQEFVDSGINQFNNTEFGVENEGKYLQSLKKAAIKDAKKAAKELAGEFDVELAKLYSVSFQPMQTPVQPYVRSAAMAMEADQGAYKNAYNTGAITLNAEVYAVYLIE
ncbi:MULTISPECIES: SIMPL domain-containing protein [Pseudoalteromonas]|uniref:SIMPL domain-containing protein n=1 Tax=Pseudoalteromonas TaxID=53246 RepID=UPI001573B3EE|nr:MULTISPECIES: SIMPL domain-containing protein [Pseudoalteromonas]MBR8844823.1 SIMPL domain-containing protein [Pseudoalteromonas sp. JC3]MCF2826380.1 SIMPL domain-containing protein [Pseudoalteromonas sp. OF5H-5]MCF2834537.1 SIMPL domain-containing protein [Pseudoalteromonas sp. DL2-H6]MCF2924600.1 SIMPL domain-containing protein [Pseudoalteromonas sp. DL2-H1]MCF7512941.1 SIMPL domain-containing protein [Pseudoalteromonas sp. L7]